MVAGEGVSFTSFLAEPSTKEPGKALVPITAKMACDESEFPIEFFQQYLASPATVHLVGRILGESHNKSSSSFMLDDGTCSVEVKYWFSVPGAVPQEIKSLSEGCYAHVVGKVSRKNGSVAVQAFSCWKVVDYNDITLHFVEAIHAYIVRVGSAKRVNVSGVGLLQACTVATNCGAVFSTSNDDSATDLALSGGDALGDFFGSLEADENPWPGAMHALDSMDRTVEVREDIDNNKVKNNVKESEELSILTPILGSPAETCDDMLLEENLEIVPSDEADEDGGLRAKILAILKSCELEVGLQGVLVDNLIEGLGVEDGLVREALLELEEVGEIYQTIDANHYRATK